VTEAMLQTDPGIVFLTLGVWVWAALRADGLPYAADSPTLRRRTTRLLVLIGVAVAMAGLRVAEVVLLGQGGWWFVQEKVVLALPLLLVPLAATLVLTLPRIIGLRRAARVFPDVLPPSLRQEASHPLLGWPVQVTAIGALAGVVVLFFVAYPATAGSSFAVATSVGLGSVAAWLRLRARHGRLGGAVVFPSRRARLARASAVVTVVATLAVAGPLAALAVAAPPADAHADAGHSSTVDLGGGPVPAHGSGPDISVDEIRTRDSTAPVRRFELTARHATITEPDGSIVDVLTYNGTVPGPELRVREGELIEVTLRNQDIAEGVTIHWHGYDLPNGEDGVAGVTQDAVAVGGSFTYRFLAKQVGTFWYHSHQRSYEQVGAGLFGVLVVEPKDEPSVNAVDTVVVLHGHVTAPERVNIATGAPTRVRLVNASDNAARAVLSGVTARLVAIDGTSLNGPSPVDNPGLRVTAGGRADVEFTMPASGVRLDFGGRTTILGPSGADPPTGSSQEIDLLSYGSPVATPFDGARFNRHFTLVLDQKVARVAGVPTMAYTVNGNAFPEIPSQLVAYGDLVKFTIVARGYEVHPIHPHGHHVLVLSRDGVRSTGSPLWMDTFEVKPGEVWEVALRADNPGIWMDHCHNLRHAAEGMVFHLTYAGVVTPYRMGGANQPE
jgi:FtsP/CotA-like multicopper oxidase with cupredoxin domain